MVAIGVGWRLGEFGEDDQDVQTSSYMRNNFWGCNVDMITIANNTVLYI